MNSRPVRLLLGAVAVLAVVLCGTAKWLEVRLSESVLDLEATSAHGKAAGLSVLLEVFPRRLAPETPFRIRLRLANSNRSEAFAIKRASLAVLSASSELPKLSLETVPPSIDPRGSWIGEWWATAPKDARTALADLEMLVGEDPSIPLRLQAGPVRLEPNWARSLRHVGLSGFEVLKDLTLPIALAFLGFWYTEHQRQRERAQRENEVVDQKRSETWNLMLPTSHLYNGKYYLPLVREAPKLAKEWKAGRFEHAAHHLLSLYKYMGVVKQEIGGCFLKDRNGESVVGTTWREFNRRMEIQIDVISRDRAVLALPLHAPYAVFMDRLSGVRDPDLLNRNRAKVSSQLVVDQLKAVPSADVELNCTLLEIFAGVLQYEANRVYELWYETESPIGRDIGEYIATLEKETDPTLQALAKLARCYFDACEARPRGELNRRG